MEFLYVYIKYKAVHATQSNIHLCSNHRPLHIKIKTIKMYSASLVALLCLASAIQGLDLRSAEEQPCFDIPKPKSLIGDMDWMISVKPIYYPLMNTIDLYHASVDLLQKNARDVSTSSVYYDACLTFEMFSNGTIISNGFNGLQKEYISKPLEDNPDAFTFEPVDGENNIYSGTFYTTLTDNKTYFVQAGCLSSGQMAWGVGSITPTLTEETKKKILEHVASLGFKKDDITELRYDTCEGIKTE
ncbi:unnamed protein product [Orchesella dallaii]|uniref:Uncharacterized protein n=1 Tax=Orchesella dallaii TaxID=48710 RepID=A0ABP1R1V8_9HEXA